MCIIEKIKSMRYGIDDRYDMSVKQAKEICSDSDGVYDICNNAFVFGYIQDVKATEKKVGRVDKPSGENEMNEEDYRYCIKKLVDMIHDEEGLKRIYNTANRVFINLDNIGTENSSK